MDIIFVSVTFLMSLLLNCQDTWAFLVLTFVSRCVIRCLCLSQLFYLFRSSTVTDEEVCCPLSATVGSASGQTVVSL